MKKYAVIVAGGSGLRMGTNLPKQFLPLLGKPVLSYTLHTFLKAFQDLEIILVLPDSYIETGKNIAENSIDSRRVLVTPGGESRFESVKKGLAHIKPHSIVFVHDGVRCLLTETLIHRCYHTAIKMGNAIPAIPAVDTIRLETVNGNKMLDRNKVRIIQTPQTFFSEILKAAFEQDFNERFTDEASVVESLGVKIHLVEGEASNIKITMPMDILIAEKILEERDLIS